MSSALSTEQLKVALWQNAYLNFCKLFCKILKDEPPVSIMNRDFFRDDDLSRLRYFLTIRLKKIRDDFFDTLNFVSGKRFGSETCKNLI